MGLLHSAAACCTAGRAFLQRFPAGGTLAEAGATRLRPFCSSGKPAASAGAKTSCQLSLLMSILGSQPCFERREITLFWSLNCISQNHSLAVCNWTTLGWFKSSLRALLFFNRAKSWKQRLLGCFWSQYANGVSSRSFCFGSRCSRS